MLQHRPKRIGLGFQFKCEPVVNGNDGSDPVGSYSGLGKVAAAANSVDPQMGN